MELAQFMENMVTDQVLRAFLMLTTNIKLMHHTASRLSFDLNFLWFFLLTSKVVFTSANSFAMN